METEIQTLKRHLVLMEDFVTELRERVRIAEAEREPEFTPATREEVAKIVGFCRSAGDQPVTLTELRALGVLDVAQSYIRLLDAVKARKDLGRNRPHCNPAFYCEETKAIFRAAGLE